MIRTAAFASVLVAAIACAFAQAPSAPPPAGTGSPAPDHREQRQPVAPRTEPEPEPEAEWGPLPEDLQTVLEAKAAGYQRRALKFSCRETVREARYSHGDATRESVREYDYLLVADPQSPDGFVALRTKPNSTSVSPESVDLSMPEPYLWGELFEPKVRSTLRFAIGMYHTTPWRLAIPIEWVSSVPVSTKQRIAEWSGTIDIEYKTGNVVRVVARPSMQDERLAAELERYMTSFRFMGFSTGAAPVGQELTVEFDFEHDNFTYPTRVELVTFQQTGPDRRETLNRRTIEYTKYRFFGADVEDRIPPMLWRPPGPDVPLPEPKPRR